MWPLLCRARPGCVDFLSSIAQNLAVYHTFAPEFAVFSQKSVPVAGQGRRLSKKVRPSLGPLCEGAPPAGGGGENCTAIRNISGYGEVLSLCPYGAPPSQREVFRHAAPLQPGRGERTRENAKWHKNCPPVKLACIRGNPYAARPAARTDRDSADKMNAIYVRFQLRQFLPRVLARRHS